jgi:hypothetical protein
MACSSTPASLGKSKTKVNDGKSGNLVRKVLLGRQWVGSIPASPTIPHQTDNNGNNRPAPFQHCGLLLWL